MAILREGDARIFRRHRATLADGWLLAVFSVPESERHRRHVLRSELTRLGFGMVAPGVWIVPAHPQDATAETLRRLGLDAYADLFHADHLAFGDPADKIRRWWDLDELERRYQAFLAAHEPALRRWEREASEEERWEQDRRAGRAADHEAFADYVRALTDWRRLPYSDPGLPAELLPDGWIGLRAADEFFALRALLEGPARAYVQRVIRLSAAKPWISTTASASHSRVTPTRPWPGSPRRPAGARPRRSPARAPGSPHVGAVDGQAGQVGGLAAGRGQRGEQVGEGLLELGHDAARYNFPVRA